jgi:hypothetical protein
VQFDALRSDLAAARNGGSMASTTQKKLIASPNRFRHVHNIAALKISDLLEARDSHHNLIANLPNVVGTAIGMYLIRRSDPDAKSSTAKWKRKDRTEARTLANSVQREWSWPCVLVFVDHWHSRAELKTHPENIVPPWLYLPDGRRVPTCTVLAPPQQYPEYKANRLTFPTGLYGGGYPVLTVEQGVERIGSIACLATNGHEVYALTNRHVAGEEGTVAYTVERGERRRVGTAVERHAGKIPLDELYPGWAGKRLSVNVDAGLFRIDALSDWTSQVYGIGRLDEPVDLNVDTMSLGLIGCPVRAFGAASGCMTGAITALFYRYRSVGGLDCVADLLIGPREDEARVETQPGDSGTLWLYDDNADTAGLPAPEEEAARQLKRPDSGDAVDVDINAIRTRLLRPLALQWGQLIPDAGFAGHALCARFNDLDVCRLLDVELLRDWSIEHSQYWEKSATTRSAIRPAFTSPKASKLRALLSANATNISVDDEDVKQGKMPMATQRDRFIALADVPDLVWRTTRKKDAANHFADMDQPAPQGEHAGKTLLELWLKKPATRTPKEWNKFYDAIDPNMEAKHRGALPFRVKQLFDEMVEHLKNESLPKFVCVAGVLAHYVGDACQPLHVSHLHHGSNPAEEEVHSIYETKMLDRYAAEFIQLLNSKLGKRLAKAGILTGDEAANATVDLMRVTVKTLSPERIIEVFNEVRGRGQLENMWQKLKTPTVTVVAEGVLTLTGIWQGAWKASKSEARISKGKAGKRIAQGTLRTLYNNSTIANSNWLRHM